MPEDRLERILNEMRNEDVPVEEIAAAQARVWDRIADSKPALCAEFRADFAGVPGTLEEYPRAGGERTPGFAGALEIINGEAM